MPQMKLRITLISLLLLGAIVTAVIIGTVASKPPPAPIAPLPKLSVSTPASAPVRWTPPAFDTGPIYSHSRHTRGPKPDPSTLVVDGATNGASTDLYGPELLAHLRDLASTNLDAALAEAMKLPEGDDRNDALQAVCFGLAQTDP